MFSFARRYRFSPPFCTRSSSTTSSPSGWTTVIGLELHCQLKSAAKLFSPASTRYDEAPNTNVALFDAALPGSLPILNPQAVRLALSAALALHCSVNLQSRFDRKHYLYHDLPPGFQITQKYKPIAHSGFVPITRGHQQVHVGIEQLQLEQDTAKTILDPIKEEVSVDLNRAGVPLIEIISKPDLRSSEEAAVYVSKVRSALRCIGACDGDMEKGSLRIDVNVSVHPNTSSTFGTRCEIKNLNSIRFMTQAIDYEVSRQIERLSSDPSQPIDQETRRYDPLTRQTYVLRSKDDAPDYRYMPDPELPPLILPQNYIDHIQKSLPELPEAMHTRLQEQYGITVDAADRLCRVESEHSFAPAVKFFEAATADGYHRPTSNWIAHDIMGLLTKHELAFDDLPITPEDLRVLISAINEKKITTTQAKALLSQSFESGQKLQGLVSQHATEAPPSNDGLDTLISELIQKHPKEAERLRQGQNKLLAFFIGQAMRASKGRADVKILGPLIQQKIRG